MFHAWLIDKTDDKIESRYTEIDDKALPEGDVSINIAYSSLNYKDALALIKGAPVARRFPLVPGIDFAGIVTDSGNPNFKAGDNVILNGWGAGEKYWGGFAQRARVHGCWLIHKPEGLTLEQAMAIGTAGYTAMLCVMALVKRGVEPEHGEIIVSGATGGVGSIAVSLLAGMGYKIAAMTGKEQEADYLKSIGAHDIIMRSEFLQKGKPLEKERWAGAIDVAGGVILANICAQMQYRGIIAACGLASGMDFPATVAPFILRGVSLIGIDSVMCPLAERIEAWNMLSKKLDKTFLAKNTKMIKLSEAKDKAAEMLSGRLSGRIVIDVNQ